MNQLFKTLLLVFFAACCAAGAYANVPPIARGFHASEFFSRRAAEGAETIYTYDNLNLVVSTEYPDATGGEKIHILDQVAPLKNVLVQLASNGTIERYYIYAPGFGLVAHIDADGTARYYHGDHLGSTIALTDANGNVTDQFNYTPYGELMARTGTTDTPYTFCGRHGVYWEGGSLYHMKARYYRADLARFISPDPLGIAGGVNLYAYANGDPIRFLDALGLCAESGEIRPSNWISSDSWWAGLINQFSNPVEYEMREFVDSRGGRANISDEDWYAAYSQAEQSEMYRDIAMDSMSVVISHSLFGGATLVPIGSSSATVPQTTAISPHRVTGPGETFVRYESAQTAYSHITPSGVTPQTYAAPISDGLVPLAQRSSVYNLPMPEIARPNVFTLRPPTGTPIIGPRPVIGGTGNEVLFPMGY